MIDFGFKISKSSTIDIEKADTSYYEQLCLTEPDARICMNCGSCSATCTAAPFGHMSIRLVIMKLQRGEDVRSMLTRCQLCGKCMMVCPRGINTRHLILEICKNYG
jgi:heterodisulfide reductase subunit C